MREDDPVWRSATDVSCYLVALAVRCWLLVDCIRCLYWPFALAIFEIVFGKISCISKRCEIKSK